MTTYEITSISRGGKRDVLATFIAQSYDLAMKHFTEWVLDWLDEENNSESIDACEKLQSLYRDNEYVDRFLLDGVFYSFRENNNNEKFQFNCPHCGGHKLIVEKPLQWIQLDVIGFDDDGDLLFDHDRPRIVDDDNDDFEIYCNDCYTQFSFALIEKMFNSND